MSTLRIGPRRLHRHFIKAWMKKKGITQEKLAGRLEIAQGTVSKILKKPSAMSEEYLYGIAEALDLNVQDLFRDPARPTQEDLLAGLTDDQRQTVVTMVEALRKAG